MTGWFLLDLFSSLPEKEITMLLQNNSSKSKTLLELTKYLKFLKFWRLIKIARMSKVITSLKKSIIYKNIENE